MTLDTSNLQDIVYGSAEELAYETMENEILTAEDEIKDITDEANIIYVEDEKSHTSSLLMFAFLIGLIIFCCKKHLIDLINGVKKEKVVVESQKDFIKEKFEDTEVDSDKYFEELLNNYEKRNARKDE